MLLVVAKVKHKMLSLFLVEHLPVSLVWCYLKYLLHRGSTWQNKNRVSWAWTGALGVSVSQDRGLRCECVLCMSIVLV